MFNLYNLMVPFKIPLNKLIVFVNTIQKGYFDESIYHNATHIMDSMQAMHYLFYTGHVRKYLQKHDILASFIANIIHDYEHPGYSN